LAARNARDAGKARCDIHARNDSIVSLLQEAWAELRAGSVNRKLSIQHAYLLGSMSLVASALLLVAAVVVAWATQSLPPQAERVVLILALMPTNAAFSFAIPCLIVYLWLSARARSIGDRLPLCKLRDFWIVRMMLPATIVFGIGWSIVILLVAT
jgi:hypothetical protein